MDERERLFFDHDVATPLSNLRGADYLLRLGLRDPDPRAAEALEILSANIHHLERMLFWYGKTRALGQGLDPVEPWPAASLPKALSSRLRCEGVALPEPRARGKLPGWAAVPPEPLTVGLIGAGVTLASASGQEPAWVLRVVRGVLQVAYEVAGDRLALDPAPLFRKFYWPGARPAAAGLDAGFPYLEAVLGPFGGTLEMVWEAGTWALLATLPLETKRA